MTPMFFAGVLLACREGSSSVNIRRQDVRQSRTRETWLKTNHEYLKAKANWSNKLTPRWSDAKTGVTIQKFKSMKMDRTSRRKSDALRVIGCILVMSDALEEDRSINGLYKINNKQSEWKEKTSSDKTHCFFLDALIAPKRRKEHDKQCR